MYLFDTHFRIRRTHVVVSRLSLPGPWHPPPLVLPGLVPGPLLQGRAAATRPGHDGRFRPIRGWRGVPGLSPVPGLPEEVLLEHRTGQRPGTGGVRRRHRDARPGPDPRRSPSMTPPQATTPPRLPVDVHPTGLKGGRRRPPSGSNPASEGRSSPTPRMASGPAAARSRPLTPPSSACGPAPDGLDGRWVSVSAEAWRLGAARTSWAWAGGRRMRGQRPVSATGTRPIRNGGHLP